MKTAERMMYYNENRKQECEDLENRVGVLIKNLTEFQKKVAWQKRQTAGKTSILELITQGNLQTSCR